MKSYIWKKFLRTKVMKLENLLKKLRAVIIFLKALTIQKMVEVIQLQVCALNFMIQNPCPQRALTKKNLKKSKT